MVQILSDPIRKAHLEEITQKIEQNASKRNGIAAVTFAELSRAATTGTRTDACSQFMSLMVFSKAGAIELKQERKYKFKENKMFGNITIFKAKET